MGEIRKKLVVAGDGACGKTCLLIVFSRDEFPEVRKLLLFSSLPPHKNVPRVHLPRALSIFDMMIKIICFEQFTRKRRKKKKEKKMAVIFPRNTDGVLCVLSPMCPLCSRIMLLILRWTESVWSWPCGTQLGRRITTVFAPCHTQTRMWC